MAKVTLTIQIDVPAYDRPEDAEVLQVVLDAWLGERDAQEETLAYVAQLVSDATPNGETGVTLIEATAKVSP